MGAHLCPGTQLWQKPHGCSHFFLATCVLALSKPYLQNHRDAQSHYGGCGPARTPSQNTLLLDHLQLWLHLAGSAPPPAPHGWGGVNEAATVLSTPSPATTYL